MSDAPSACGERDPTAIEDGGRRAQELQRDHRSRGEELGIQKAVLSVHMLGRDRRAGGVSEPTTEDELLGGGDAVTFTTLDGLPDLNERDPGEGEAM